MMQPNMDEQSEGVICKYCFENKKTSTEKFITPCSCKNPICLQCFNTRKAFLMNPAKCEVCNTNYIGPYAIQPDITIQINTPARLPVDEVSEHSGLNVLKGVCICFTGCFVAVVATMIVLGLVTLLGNGWD